MVERGGKEYGGIDINLKKRHNSFFFSDGDEVVQNQIRIIHY